MANEDAGFVGNRLLVVADGMGGLPAGELASDILVQALGVVDEMPDTGEPLQDLIAALQTANEHIEAAIADDDARDGMGTTVTALLLSGDRMAALNVGDSPSVGFSMTCRFHVSDLPCGFSNHQVSSPGNPMMMISVQPSWLMS